MAARGGSVGEKRTGIKDFRVVKRLGKGAFGEVYKVRLLDEGDSCERNLSWAASLPAVFGFPQVQRIEDGEIYALKKVNISRYVGTFPRYIASRSAGGALPVGAEKRW